MKFPDVVPGGPASGEVVRVLIEAEKGYGTEGYERSWLVPGGDVVVLALDANGVRLQNPATGAVLIRAHATGALASKDDGTTAPTPIIVEGSAAGGDLAGTYPDPTLSSAIVDALVPPGQIVAYGGAAAPTGWLLCDGSVISRTTYAKLFAAIGTTY